MSLLFNMLSRLVIAFHPRSKHLLISWLQSSSAVILEPKKIVCHCFHCFPIYLPWRDGTGCHDLSFLNIELLSQLLHSPLSPSSRGSIPSLQKTKIMASGRIASWQIDGKTMQTDLCCNVSAFNMLSRLVITFLPRNKHLLISLLQSPSTVILEPRKIKSDAVSIVSPSISCEVMGSDAIILVFWMLSFKQTFSLSFFTFIKRLFSSFSLSAIRVASSAYLRLLIFLPAILIPACDSSRPVFLMILCM